MTREPPGGPGEEALERLGTGARRRVRDALMDLVIEVGFEELTVEAVSDRARVPRDAFQRTFARLEDCYTWVHEENSRDFEELVMAAFEADGSWRERLRAAAYAAARYMEGHPREVRFGITEMFVVGPMAQAVRERGLHRMVELIDAGRAELDDPDSIDRGVAEGVFGAIYSTLTSELQRRPGVPPAADFVPGMMYLAVGPYLGQEAAREELERAEADRERYDRGEI